MFRVVQRPRSPCRHSAADSQHQPDSSRQARPLANQSYSRNHHERENRKHPSEPVTKRQRDNGSRFHNEQGIGRSMSRVVHREASPDRHSAAHGHRQPTRSRQARPLANQSCSRNGHERGNGQHPLEPPAQGQHSNRSTRYDNEQGIGRSMSKTVQRPGSPRRHSAADSQRRPESSRQLRPLASQPCSRGPHKRENEHHALEPPTKRQRNSSSRSYFEQGIGSSQRNDGCTRSSPGGGLKHSQAPSARVLTTWLKQVTTVQRLQEFVQQHSQHMDHIHISAAVSRLGHMQLKGQLRHDGKASQLLAQLEQLLQPHLQQCDCRGLANLVWGFGVLGYINTAIQQACLDRFMQQLHAVQDSQHVANVLYGAAKAGLRLGKEDMQKLIAALGRPVVLKTAKPRELSTTMWAAATMQYKMLQHRLQQLVTAFLQPSNLSVANAQSISNLLWAAAKMQHKLSRPQMHQLVVQLLSLLQTAQPRHVSNTLWAAATMQCHLPEEQVQQLVTALVGKQRDANAQDASNTLWALATMQRQLPGQLIDHLVSVLIAGLPAAAPQAVSNSLSACAQFRVYPAELFAALNSQHHWDRLLPAMDSQKLANTALACAKLGHRDEGLMARLVQYFMPQVQDGSSSKATQEICNVVWSVAVLGIQALAEAVAELVSRVAVYHNLQREAFAGEERHQLYYVHLWLLHCQLAGGSGLAGVLTEQQLLECKESMAAQHKAIAAEPCGQFEHGIFAALQQLPFQWKEQPQMQQVSGPDCACLVDIAGRLADGTLLAVEADGPSHYVRNGRDLQLDGRTQFRNGLLAASGYVVVSIPYYRWHGLDKEQQVQFLSQQIQQNLPQPKAPPGPVLTSLIKKATTVQRLQELVQQHGQHMDSIHFSAAVNKLGHWQKNGQLHSAEQVSQLLAQLEELFQPRLQRCGCRELANLVWGFGVLGYSNTGMMQACLDQYMQQLHAESKAQHVSNVLYGVAKAGLQLQGEHVQKLIAVLTSETVMATALPQDVSITLWAVATTRHRILRPQLQQLVTAFLEPSKLSVAKPQEISNVLWAVATLQHKLSTQQTQQLIAQFVRLLPSAKQQEVSNTMWAAATMQLQLPDMQAEEIVRAFVRQRVTKAQHVANLLWALATMHQRLPPHMLDQVIQASIAVLPAANPQDVSISLWACAQLRLHPTDLFAALNSLQLWDRLLPDMKPQHLANTAQACAKLGYKDEGLMAKLLQYLLQQVQSGRSSTAAQQISAQHVCNATWSVAVLGLQACAESVAKLVSCAVGSWQWNECTPEHRCQLYQVHLWLLYCQLAGGSGLAGVLTEQQLQDCMESMAAQYKATAAEPCSCLKREIGAALNYLPLAWQQQPKLQQLSGPDCACLIDIAGKLADGTLLAVEADGPSHYVRNGRRWRLEGSTQFRNRLLAASGYVVVSVPYFEWNELDSNQRIHYLSRRIEMALQQHPSNVNG